MNTIRLLRIDITGSILHTWQQPCINQFPYIYYVMRFTKWSRANCLFWQVFNPNSRCCLNAVVAKGKGSSSIIASPVAKGERGSGTTLEFGNFSGCCNNYIDKHEYMTPRQLNVQFNNWRKQIIINGPKEIVNLSYSFQVFPIAWSTVLWSEEASFEGWESECANNEQ